MICLLLSLILTNNPNLDVEYAMKLANTTYVYSVAYGVDPVTVQAIFMQESAYKLDAINKRTQDYGIGQVNKYHIKNDKLDKDKLIEDVEYSVKHSIRIFSWFYKTYGKHEAIKRYNCGTRKDCIKMPSVIHYHKKVISYSNKTNTCMDLTEFKI